MIEHQTCGDLGSGPRSAGLAGLLVTFPFPLFRTEAGTSFLPETLDENQVPGLNAFRGLDVSEK